ncbi:MAG: glutathione-disulfide reductase [Planktomarina sp.]
MKFDYDLFVIGGGSGGVRAARVAATGGATVALAEEDRYGGTCVIRGCVPKKLMVFASTYAPAMAQAAAYGWSVTTGEFNWPAFQSKLHGELDRLEGIYRKLLKNAGVVSFDARATIAGPNTVRLSDGREITAKTILVAAGGWPSRPDVPGVEHTITSNEVFHLDALPKKILIVGGGYIACEFAGIMNGLGVETHLWYRGDQVLRGFDDEARNLIAEGMVERGVKLTTGINITAVAKSDQGLQVTATDGAEHAFDQVMYATGRAPNSANLGLEDLGVALGGNGAVQVDEYSQTAVPSIYAIGDVTDRVNLTPVAIREGMAFVETVMNDNPTPVDHDLIPSAVFTQPEYGTVGLSEEAARAQEPIEVYATTFRPMNTSFIGEPHKVLMKLVVSQATRKVLGCHIVADGAGEMIQMAGIAVKMGATKEDFDRVCAVHPTMSEELVTMKTPVRSA